MGTRSIYQVYVLQNSRGQKYIGLSGDIQKRIEKHNSMENRWTSGKGPWFLIWKSGYLILSDARKLENKLKRQKGGIGFTTITGINPDRENPIRHDPATAGL